MKKFVPIIIIIILALVGAYFFLSQKASPPQTGQVDQTPKTQGNVITSIRDAMMKSMSLKCEYPDEKGNTVTSYVKGESIRVMGYAISEQAGEGNLLMKDKKMYMWDDQTKKGTVIDLNVEVTPGASETSEGRDQEEEAIENLEKYKDYCKTAVVSDSMFVLPTDVEFVDFAKQMKESGVDFQKMMEQYKEITPPLEEE